jgi:hypothetical protein
MAELPRRADWGSYLEVFKSTELREVAIVEGNGCIRKGCSQKNARDSVPERGTKMGVIAMFFDPCAPDILTTHVSVFS